MAPQTSTCTGIPQGFVKMQILTPVWGGAWHSAFLTAAGCSDAAGLQTVLWGADMERPRKCLRVSDSLSACVRKNQTLQL